MSLFADFEKTIERGFRKWTDRVLGPAEANELVIVHRRILEQVESRVETLARGLRVFPYSGVIVILRAADAERRARWQAAFSEGDRLQSDIREVLTAAPCEFAPSLTVQVQAAEPDPQNSEEPFAIEYIPVSAPAASVSAPTAPVPIEAPAPVAPSPAAPSPAKLVVLKGKTQCGEYALQAERINLGRMGELTDSEQRVVLRNDVVFEEGADEVNGTVSRRHAHIRREGADYRLCDDESEFGTRVFRNGRPIEVPAGNRRGEKLRPGDEIYLGRACLRFEQ
jgi:FHA domain